MLSSSWQVVEARLACREQGAGSPGCIWNVGRQRLHGVCAAAVWDVGVSKDSSTTFLSWPSRQVVLVLLPNTHEG